MTRSDGELIRDALDHFRVLHLHMNRADLADQTVADAVSLRLGSAIESLSACSPGVRDRVFGGEWAVAWATRNRIAQWARSLPAAAAYFGSWMKGSGALHPENEVPS